MEEIDLSTDEDITQFTDEEQVAVKKINREFIQENKLKGIVRKFTIFNDIQCYQSVKRKHGGKHKFRVNLTHLNPKPKRDFKLADSWLITAAISAILSFLLIYMGWFSSMQLNHQLLFMLTAFTVSFSVIALLIALLKTRDRILMFSNCGCAQVLEFINNTPNRESFNEFIDLLSSHIIKAQQSSGLTPTERLVFELKELRRLKDENVIPVNEYELAKQRIFKNKAFTS